MSKLVIVESPAKAKNIKGYLGKGYEVIASMGHVRDLPAARLSVDIEHNFEPKYAVIKGKEALVDELKTKAHKADCVYLATDPDREGEAISWHLANLLDLKLSDKNRVTFNEITKTGVKNGMENPRQIDIDLVNAQSMPIPPAKIPSLLLRGLRFIISGSPFSRPSASAGKQSVIRLIQSK